MRTPGTAMKDARFFSLPRRPSPTPSLSFSSTRTLSVSSIQRSQWALLAASYLPAVQLFPWHAAIPAIRLENGNFPGISLVLRDRPETSSSETIRRDKARGSRSGILSAAFSWITTLFVLLCDPDELRGKLRGLRGRQGGRERLVFSHGGQVSDV